MDKIILCPFTDNDEANVTNLLALEITRQESHFQGTGRLACHPANPWHSGGQHCRSTKGRTTTTSFIAYLNTTCLRNNNPPFPPDTTLPIPLGKGYTHMLHQPSDIHVYLYQERLGYVISIPSAYKRTFSIFRTIPIPVHMDQENFLYIDVGYSTLRQENYVELAWFPSHGFSLTVEVFYSWWILLVCGTLPPLPFYKIVVCTARKSQVYFVLSPRLSVTYSICLHFHFSVSRLGMGEI